MPIRAIISREKYLLILLVATIFLPCVGATNYRLALFFLYLPIVFSGLQVERLSCYLSLVTVASLSFFISCQAEFYLLIQAFINGYYNLDTTIAILLPIKYTFMMYCDVLVISSLILTLSLRDISYLRSKLIPIIKVYALLSVVFIGMQLKGISLFSLNQNNFWIYVKRYSGLASDPNAFGLVLGLFSMVLISQTKLRPVSNVLTLFLLLILSQFSGSRTFYIFFFLSLLTLIKVNKRFLLLVPVSILLVLISAVAAKGFIPETSSLRRLLDTLDPNTISEMLSSRGTFLKLALEGVSRRPILAYGLGGFYNNLEYLDAMSKVGIASWRDNSNNFYFELALSIGLPLTIYFLYFNLKNWFRADPEIKIFTAIIGASLVTGPHLYFIEVYILTLLFLIPLYFKENTKLSFRSPLFITILACIAASSFIDEKESLGLYGVEADNSRWLSKKAYIQLCVPRDKVINIKNLHPTDSISYSVEVLGVENNLYSNVMVAPGESSVFRVSNSFTIDSNRTWTPFEALGIDDHRVISLQISWDSGFTNCL